MNLLRLVVVIFCIASVVLVFRNVASGKLMLKYSLLYLTLTIVIFLVALFPDPVFDFAHVLGFDAPSNFIFFIALFFLLAICISLSVVVSRQSRQIKTLIQNHALLEEEVRSAIAENEDQ